MSLGHAFATTTITATDLDEAKAFYTEKLGLKEAGSSDEGGLLFEAGSGTKVYIYNSGAPKATNTVVAFTVDDVLAEVNELKGKGIEFESYDMGEIKTDENNIAHMGDLQAAWFKDPAGNIIGISNQ